MAFDKPFFTYVALSQVHPTEKAHPAFDQTDPTGLGLYADLFCCRGVKKHANRNTARHDDSTEYCAFVF